MYNFVSIGSILEKNSSFSRDFAPIFYNSGTAKKNIWPAIYVSHIHPPYRTPVYGQSPASCAAACYSQQKKQRTAPVLCFFASSVARPRGIRSHPSPERPPAQAGQYNYLKYSRYSSEKIFPPSRLIPPYKCCIIRGSIASRFFVSIICIIS